MPALLASSAIFALSAQSPVSAADTPLDLEAGTIEYLEDGKVVAATGGVIVTSDEHGRIEAEGLKYFTEEDKLIATGHVVFTDTDGMVTRTQNLEIDDEFKEGVTSLLLVELSPDNSAHFWAKKARLDGNTLIFTDAVYSACPLPDDLRENLEDGDKQKVEGSGAPVWQIRSDEARADMDEEIVVHKNMWFDVYGQPVFWLPYMRHAATSEKALSGFLKPELATSGNRGEEITTQYYWRQAPNLDATLEARYMSKRGLLASGEQRFRVGNTSGRFLGGVIDDDELNDTRAYIIGSTEHVVSPGQRFGINVQQATDDTFFDDFLGFNPNFLTSSVYAEDASEDHYFGISSTFYEDIRLGRNENLTPQPIIDAEFEREFNIGSPNEQIFVAADLLTLEREQGLDMRRLSTRLGWQKHINTESGNLFDLEASVRGDVYNIDNNTTTNQEWAEQITPQISAMWQNPFISEGGSHVVTPMVKVVGTTTNNNAPEVPNEDSFSFELDAANLFQENRFAGQDRIENGVRVIYGLENTWTQKHSQAFSLFLGQSWRTGSDNTFPSDSGHTTKLSDWVGQARLQTGLFSLTNRFRLDKDSLDPRRVDSFFTVGRPDDSFLSLTYSFEQGGAEEIRGDARWEVNNAWALSGRWQRDLTSGGRLLQAEGGITYTHCCYEVAFKVRRRGFENRNVESSTDFIINFGLLTSGRKEDE